MKLIHPNPSRLSAMLVAMVFVAVSCGPRPVILDTDWWTDVDDAMAVRLALRADERDEIRLMGICVDAVRETSIPSLRAFLQLEGRPEILLGADFDAVDGDSRFAGGCRFQHGDGPLPSGSADGRERL